MSDLETSWTLIREAANGNSVKQATFAKLYGPILRKYFEYRWPSNRQKQEVDDGVQEVLLLCIRPDGPLSRVDPAAPAGFRGFLKGIARNIALKINQREKRACHQPDEETRIAELAGNESSAADQFDRSWALMIMHEARKRFVEQACDASAKQRVELLRLRFEEGEPIREIAVILNPDCQNDTSVFEAECKKWHREFQKAKTEFWRALLNVVAIHSPGTPAEIERECRDLLNALS